MSYSLILDTTTKFLVVGLANENNVIDEIKYEAWQRQSEFVCLEIDNILKRNNLTSSDIVQIIVSNGPGSYTGVRIALTVAKVWTIAKDVKIKVLSSLQSIAGLGDKIAILDARSNRFYVGVYKDGIAMQKDTVLEKEELIKLIEQYKGYELVGDIDALGLERKDINYSKNMLNLAKLVDFCTDIDSLVPVYLKEEY